MQCVTQLEVSENILQSFISETVYNVIVSQMKESTVNHLRVVFKTNPKPFNVEVNMKH